MIDGDTLQLGGTTYRIEGIDASEFGQRCSARSGPDWPCGKEALELMVQLTEGYEVTFSEGFPDQYERTIATFTANGVDLGAEIVRQGMAGPSFASRTHTLSTKPRHDQTEWAVGKRLQCRHGSVARSAGRAPRVKLQTDVRSKSIFVRAAKSIIRRGRLGTTAQRSTRQMVSVSSVRRARR